MDSAIEITGAAVMLIYLWLEYRASLWLWPVGVLMPLLYIYIYYTHRFYADMAINVYYFAASVYGWSRWKKHSDDDESKIRFTPVVVWFQLTAAFAVIFAALVTILLHTDDIAPFGDAFTTAMSVVGMWMLAHRYVEQWWIWSIVNIVSSALYFSKEMIPTGSIYAIYSIVSIFGYLKWKRLMKN